MIQPTLTLFWQLLVPFACSCGIGLYFRFLLPNEFSPLQKVLFSLLGGFFLLVLVAQNLVYLGLPVRISAWLLLGPALPQVWLCRSKILAWVRWAQMNTEFRVLAVVIFLTVAFHGFVPIRQGLEWYYGRGHFDQINYVMLAEFLKEEPYSTSQQNIGLHPWLLYPVGFRESAKPTGSRTGTRQQAMGLKEVRIGQSILTAEIVSGRAPMRKEALPRHSSSSFNDARDLCLCPSARDGERSLYRRVRRAIGSAPSWPHQTIP